MKRKVFITGLLWLVFIYAKAQIITTIAGIPGTYTYSGDGGQATDAKLWGPAGIVIDITGNIYVAEQDNNRIRKINTSGIISTFAGNGTVGYSGDGGVATAAQFKTPTGLAFDKLGNLYVVDRDNYCVRKINTNGIISTIAGTGVQGYSGDEGQATAAQLSNTGGVSFDKSGNLYIGACGNSVVRMINTAGIITTVIGTGTIGNSGDGGQASMAELDGPCFAIADTTAGNFYISDEVNNNIRKVNSSGIISTISNGSGIDEPEMIALDKAGNLYVADFNNNRIVMISSFGTHTTIVGTGTAGYNGDGGLATAAELNNPFGIVFDTTGNLYIADWGNSVIRKVTNVGQNAGIKKVTDNNIRVIVFPNPSNGKLYISNFDASQKTTNIEVTDITGKLIAKQQTPVNNNLVELNLDVNNGVYFVKVVTDNGNIQMQKVIISK